MTPQVLRALATVAVLALGMGLALAALAVLAARTNARPELLRKLVHIGAGLAAVSFAWLFRDTWPVVLVSLGGVAFVLGVRRWAPLKRTIGPLLHGVERKSFGDYCLPMVVPLVHGFAMPDRVLYVVPILVLTLADAAAALVGVRVGRLAYRTDEGTKTVEGSLAMALVAGLIVVTALWIHGVHPGRAIAIAAMISMLVMLAEAVCWRGLDNLVVPLGTLALLRLYLEMPVRLLGLRFGVGLGLVILAIVWHRFAGLIGAAGLAIALIVYASWALGGWVWVIPPLGVVIALPFLGARAQDTSAEDHGVGAVLSFGLGPLLWVFYEGTGRTTESMLVPFSAACCAALGVLGVVRWRYDRARGRCDRLLVGKLILLTLGIGTICGMVTGGSGAWWPTVIFAPGALGAAAALTAISPAERPGRLWEFRWVARSVTILGVSAIPLGVGLLV